MKIEERRAILLEEIINLNLPEFEGLLKPHGDIIQSNCESLDIILKAHGDVIQSIYEARPKLRTGEVYLETLSIKLIYASRSALQLSKGSEVSTLKYPKITEVIDLSSLYILTRSIIEAFLTLEYLYFNDLDRDEQVFRYNLWRISGFMARSRLDFSESTSKKFAGQFERERKEIEQLKTEIKQSPYYETLKDNNLLWKLDRYGLPRVISWSNLILKSKLHNKLFSNFYSLSSNYAHSEFISAIQLNERELEKQNPHSISTTIISLSKIRMINCVSIMLLKDKFECTNEAYQKLDERLIVRIELLNKFATEFKMQ